ncbi:MAG: hypothetical protein AAFN94_03665 [Pseudomonadota bacterium]
MTDAVADPGPFRHQNTGRNRATLIAVMAVWLAMGLAWQVLDASLILVSLAGFATLPALYDLASGRLSGVEIGPETLSWFSGSRKGEVALHALDHVRLDTRLDFSVRASAVLTNGRKVRLPLESIPPADAFETALSARGIRVERHHFSLLG